MSPIGKPEQVKPELRSTVNFSSIKPVFTKEKIIEKSSEISVEKEYKLYQGKIDEAGAPILILDRNGYVNRNIYKYSLANADIEIANELLKHLPEKQVNIVKNILQQWKLPSENIAEALVDNTILTTPVPRLKNPSVVLKLDWQDFIDNKVISYGGCEKDERLKLVYKATLLRGIKQRFNPHTLISVNPNTGRSHFYDRAGKRIDKTTKNRLIGYVDSKGVHYGAINGLDIPLIIEQIESQDAPEILGFLLTFMDMGKATSSTASGDVENEGNCTIIITANPTGYDIDRIGTFRALIDHLTSNTLALGRRIGLIVYGVDYQVVEGGRLEEAKWTRQFQIFRAIEEYTFPMVKKYVESDLVADWMDKPINHYETRVQQLTKKIYDKDTVSFLMEHAKNGHPHLRGACLNCVIIDFLPKFVEAKLSGKKAIDDVLALQILSRANTYLKEFVAINLESIANIGKCEEQVKDLIWKSKQLPKYVKEIIIAVNAYKQGAIQTGTPIPRQLLMDNLESIWKKIPDNEKTYQYWSSVIDILERTNINRYNTTLSKYFGFTVERRDKKTYIINLQ